MTSSEASPPARTTVRIPTASGEEIEAWIYRPDGDGPHPAVVMAHGFAAVKAGGLAPFAERFRREGFTAVVFDYRQWGGSDGEPRDEVSVPRQREDYRTVIDWAAADEEIDPARIFIWGTSFSGLHAVEIAATDSRLRGAIAQSPLVDGLAGAKMIPLSRSLRLLSLGVRDRLGSFLGRPPRYIPSSAAPGELGAVASEDALSGLDLITPKDGTEWHNRVAARSLLGIAAHRPVRRAAQIGCPIQLLVPEVDNIAPVGPVLRVAERAPNSELHRTRGGHYGTYEGGEAHNEALRLEVEFLKRHAGLLTS